MPQASMSQQQASFWREDRVYIIAEAGSNWRMGAPARDMEMARTLIDAAAEAGADAVKFQTFQPHLIYAPGAGASTYLSQSGITQTMEEIFADLAMPHGMLPELAAHAKARGIDFMSTAFSAPDFAAVDPLVSVHKVASYEVTHPRLIELCARSGKPTLMSTGAATMDDIAWAVAHYREHGGRDLCLLQCTAKYPAPLDAMNLRTITEFQQRFGLPAGLSDHSRDPIIAPVCATALGARAIEKHFTIDNRLPGPDHPFAMTWRELADMVKAVRAAEKARGDGQKRPHDVERELESFAQRALQALRPIKRGDVLVEDENVAILRAGNQRKGAHPKFIDALAGKRATRDISAGDGIREGDWAD